jgi:hypothetical protein
MVACILTVCGRIGKAVLQDRASQAKPGSMHGAMRQFATVAGRFNLPESTAGISFI